jgi:hypothetical protein
MPEDPLPGDAVRLRGLVQPGPYLSQILRNVRECPAGFRIKWPASRTVRLG